MSGRVMSPAPVTTPPRTQPKHGGVSVIRVATEVVTEVGRLEQVMQDEEWLPKSWLAKNGPTIRDRRDGMVLLHRGWNAVMEENHSKGGDLTSLKAAMLELAAAAMKVAADIDGYKAAEAPLATEVDCLACGLVPVSAPARSQSDDEEAETEPEADDAEE